jgi:hypothetical protein
LRQCGDISVYFGKGVTQHEQVIFANYIHAHLEGTCRTNHASRAMPCCSAPLGLGFHLDARSRPVAWAGVFCAFGAQMLRPTACRKPAQGKRGTSAVLGLETRNAQSPNGA